MERAAFGDRLTTMAAGPKKVEADKGDEDEGGEEVDHQQVSNESEIKKAFYSKIEKIVIGSVKTNQKLITRQKIK